MWIVRHRKILFTITAILLAASFIVMVRPGLSFGIDFVGGALLEVEYADEIPDIVELRDAVHALDIGSVSLRPTEDRGVIIRTRDLSEEERVLLLEGISLNEQYTFEETRFNSIGSTIGKELRDKAFFALIAVLLAIICYIAFTFRHVSKPVSSWKYGLIAIVALAHDIVIPLGAFVVYGFFTHAEIDILFVMAILAILGYSVNDTIVVFDRIRENLANNQIYNVHESFEETVGRSVSQTFARSINTSLTTLFTLVTLFLIGGDATKHFAFTLLVGVIAGSYSSIFLAAPFLVELEKRQRRN